MVSSGESVDVGERDDLLQQRIQPGKGEGSRHGDVPMPHTHFERRSRKSRSLYDADDTFRK